MAAQFVWHDLMTTDPEKAKAFYTGLFGWNLKPWDMGEMGTYTGFVNGEESFGGINSLDPAHGVPTHWLCYLQTPGGVDTACAKIAELGGTVHEPPFAIPTVGRIAVASDPQGAFFAPFEPENGQEASPPAYPTPKGGVAWHELMAPDPAAAASFYTAITGLTSSVQDMGTGPYTLLLAGEQDYRAGIMQTPDDMPMSAWMIYFEIAQESMDEALAEVRRLGGAVAVGPLDIPTVGVIGVATDPTGGVFGLMKSAPMPG